jgi:hypothetical protein
MAVVSVVVALDVASVLLPEAVVPEAGSAWDAAVYPAAAR